MQRKNHNPIPYNSLAGTTESIPGNQLHEAFLKTGDIQTAILNNAHILAIATDNKGIIQLFNIGAEQMLGYQSAEAINKIKLTSLFDQQALAVRAKALTIELGTPVTTGFEALVFKASHNIDEMCELTCIRKDDSRFPAIVSVTAVHDNQNKIVGYLLACTDNSAAKQVEQLNLQLRDLQFFTRFMLESNIDALIITDPSGIITDANMQMESLTGCPRDALIGSALSNYLTGANSQPMDNATPYELTVRAKDGKETPVSCHSTDFHDHNGTLQAIFTSAHDITCCTQLNNLNASLEIKLSKEEKANRAKSVFLSRMSHELRTPLNSMLGFAQLLEAANPPPEAKQLLRIQQITKAGWYLLDLLNEILDLAAIESGKLSFSHEPILLLDIMTECLTLTEPVAQKHGIKLNLVPFDKSLAVHADRIRLKQALINLLTNAIKYNREEGLVEVKCTCIQNLIRIGITDNGMGLSPEQQAQLFQPFNRLGKETCSEEGTGIGLVVTKLLVELMGGSIGVNCSTGKGSEFWIELIKGIMQPPPDKQTLPIVGLLQTPKKLAQRTLLYVEENTDSLMLVEQIIECLPQLNLLSARNCYQGLKLACTCLPNIILLNVNLPDISGIEALKILHKNPATAHIPVIAISALAIPGEIEESLTAGFFRYLTKPLKINDFINALNDALKFSETNPLTTNEGEQTP